jgi:hypothetical protein
MEDIYSSETSVDFAGLRDIISHKMLNVNNFHNLLPIANYFIIL